MAKDQIAHKCQSQIWMPQCLPWNIKEVGKIFFFLMSWRCLEKSWWQKSSSSEFSLVMALGVTVQGCLVYLSLYNMKAFPVFWKSSSGETSTSVIPLFNSSLSGNHKILQILGELRCLLLFYSLVGLRGFFLFFKKIFFYWQIVHSVAQGTIFDVL